MSTRKNRAESAKVAEAIAKAEAEVIAKAHAEAVAIDATHAEVAEALAEVAEDTAKVAEAEVAKIAEGTEEVPAPTMVSDAEVSKAKQRLQTLGARFIRDTDQCYRDLSVIALAVPATDLLARMGEEISAHAFGKIYPEARKRLAKDWDAATRVGGPVERKDIAKILGVSPATITNDLNAESGGKTLLQRLQTVDTMMTKLTEEVGLTDDPEINEFAARIERKARKLQAAKTS